MSIGPEQESASLDPTMAMARTLRLVLEIYLDPARVQAFLILPHPLLDGRSPLQTILSSADGACLVGDLLGRMAYGGGV